MNIFVDGTWNTPKDNTNVYKMYLKYGGYYFPGPGTKESLLNKWIGGAFGKGVEGIVAKAKETYDLEYRGGPVRIVGFSRGATVARKLASEIAKEGGTIDFLGCFDTVGALGVPFSFWPFTIYDDLFMDLDIHPNVKKAAHAKALEEDRNAFQNTPMNPRGGVVEKGFHGNHGYAGCSEETFDWMVQRFDQSS